MLRIPRLLCLTVVLTAFQILLAQTKRVEGIDLYWDENSTSPNEIYHYQYDDYGRIARLYEEKGRQDMAFDYDDDNGIITINGKKGHDWLKCEARVVNNRIIGATMYDDSGDPFEFIYTYDDNGRLSGDSMDGMDDGYWLHMSSQYVWENGNIVKAVISEDESDGEFQVVEFSDHNYPENFPMFLVPGAELDAFDMASPPFHLASLFGKRQTKLYSKITGQLGGEEYVYTYDYEVDNDGDITEIIYRTDYYHGYVHHREYDRLVFHYEQVITGMTAIPHYAEGHNWATFYSNSASYELPDGVTAYTATVNGSQVILHKLGSIIPRGCAVILVSETNKQLLLSKTEKDVDPDYVAMVKLNDLQGVATKEETCSIDGVVYVMGTTVDGFGFHRYSASELPIGRAFLVLSEQSRQLSICFDDVTNVTDGRLPTIHNPQNSVFDLQGRKLSSVSMHGNGIVIVNGKKVAISK